MLSATTLEEYAIVTLSNGTSSKLLWWLGLLKGEHNDGSERMTWAIESAILIICFVYLFHKYWRTSGNGNERCQNKSKGFYITWISHLPIKIPYLEGGITLFKLRKYGVKILEHWTKGWGQGGVFAIEAGPELVYVITDATVAQKILSSTDPGHLNKPKKLYDKIFAEWLNGGLVNSYYEKWASHRKVLSRAFTYKSLQTYLKFIMNEHAKNLAKDLLKNCNQANNTIEGKKMYELIYFHTIKIISQILMGNQSCTDEQSAEFHQHFEAYKHCVLYRFLHPELFIEPIWMLHPKKRQSEIHLKWCNEFCMMIINKYKAKWDVTKDHEFEEAEPESDNEDGNVGDDGVKPLRCMVEEMLYSKMPDKDMLEEIGTFMSAGHETTAVALQMLMFNLALNPVHQSRCHEEIDALFNSKLVSSDFDYDLNVDDLSSLKYLERCILESGRITPTVPIFARRLDVPLKISEELELPGESTVVFLPWTMHRDPKHYEEPEKFDPSRFLPENVKKRHPGAYISFSGGARNCIGWKVAGMEIKVIMTWLLRYFEIQTTDGPDDVRLGFDVTLSLERHYNIILKQRSHNT